MISPELIAAHSKYLAAQRGDQHFIPECRRLMDAVKDGVISAFSSEIASGVLADHWGRVGVECVLKKLPQWLFFGVYYDPYDHGIEFKKKMNRSLPSSLMHIPVVGTTWHSCLA